MYSKKNLRLLESFLDNQQLERKSYEIKTSKEMHKTYFNKNLRHTKRRNKFKKLFKSNRKYSNRVKKILKSKD